MPARPLPLPRESRSQHPKPTAISSSPHPSPGHPTCSGPSRFQVSISPSFRSHLIQLCLHFNPLVPVPGSIFLPSQPTFSSRQDWPPLPSDPPMMPADHGSPTPPSLRPPRTSPRVRRLPNADLILPRDGHGARGELGVEVVVRVVQVDALHGGELLDVQHVLTVHGPGLGQSKPAVTRALPWRHGPQPGLEPLPHPGTWAALSQICQRDPGWGKGSPGRPGPCCSQASHMPVTPSLSSPSSAPCSPFLPQMVFGPQRPLGLGRGNCFQSPLCLGLRATRLESECWFPGPGPGNTQPRTPPGGPPQPPHITGHQEARHPGSAARWGGLGPRAGA